MRCSKCSSRAVTYIAYNGTHLCREHFADYVEQRVMRDIRKQGLPEGVIAVALSGGKDSLTALYILHDIIEPHRSRELHAITVDEGIEGYRPASLEVASRHCEKLGVPHHVISFENVVDMTMDDIAQRDGELGECAYCGVFRRQCLNLQAKKIDAAALVMGHNLDDVSQSILMNFVNGDMRRMARFAPHEHVQPGLVPRLVPLRSITEKECTLYALLRGLDVLEDECPYAVSAHRGLFRDIVMDMEARRPGTRHSILASYQAIEDCLADMYPPADLQPCQHCGEPSSQPVCRACQLKEKLQK